MKICIITNEYPPNVTAGSGTASNTLAKGLTKKGHEVTIITSLFKTDKRNEESKNLKIIRLPIPQSKFLEKFNLVDNRILFGLALRRMRKDFDFSHFDILHIYDMHVSYFLTKEVLSKVKTIISVNDHYSFITPWNIFKFPYPTPNLFKRYIYSNITKILNTYSLRRVEYIFAITEYNKKIVVDYCKIPEQRVKVIYRGIELKRFFNKENKYRSKKIIFIGSNMERKGVSYLLKAMPDILKKYPEASLTIIGRRNQALDREFKKIIFNLGIGNAVDVKERVPPSEIPNYFADANVFVLPAIIEALAVTLLEAMSSQTPVVATRVGGHEEAIVEGAGILINPRSSEEISNAINGILSDSKKARAMGKNALLVIKQKFPEERMIEEVEKAYQQILANKYF